MPKLPDNLPTLFAICLALFACLVREVESHENPYNTTNPIESPRIMFFRSADKACTKAIREDDAKCYQVYSNKYKTADEKSHCCYYFSMYNCLENAVRTKCDLQTWKTFKANVVFEASTQFITKYNCPNYQTYEACQFPLKKVLIISGSVFAVVLAIIALLLYRHYHTGFHKVATNDV